METDDDRRRFLKLAGVSGVVFASGLAGCSQRTATNNNGGNSGGAGGGADEDFFFLQVTDTHWGYSGPNNPEADVTLGRAVAQINQLAQQPDFIIFTGDLTHSVDDPATRAARMASFKSIVGDLKAPLRFLPGENDAALDAGAAYQAAFGPPYYSFDHKGVHFVALDNVSDPRAVVGDGQIQWLRDDLARLPAAMPVVVLAHRPLFDLYPDWDWSTRDAAAVIDVLQTRQYVTVFYGHVHQELDTMTGGIAHHAARSLIFPFPPPPQPPIPSPPPARAAVPWDAASPDHGLGLRRIARKRPALYAATGIPYEDVPVPQTVKITAQKFEFTPGTVTLQVGVPVILEITSLDTNHGFNSPELHIDEVVSPGVPTRIRLTPDRAGTFAFHCSVFCGEGHDGMSGQIVVTP